MDFDLRRTDRTSRMAIKQVQTLIPAVSSRHSSGGDLARARSVRCGGEPRRKAHQSNNRRRGGGGRAPRGSARTRHKEDRGMRFRLLLVAAGWVAGPLVLLAQNGDLTHQQPSTPDANVDFGVLPIAPLGPLPCLQTAGAIGGPTDPS